MIVALAERLLDQLARRDPLAERVKLGPIRASTAGGLSGLCRRPGARGMTSAAAVIGRDDPALATVDHRARAAAGSSFYWGMRLLEPRRRMAMYAVYAFCREVDDIADGDTALPSDKLAALERWRIAKSTPFMPAAAIDGPGDARWSVRSPNSACRAMISSP